VIPFARFVQIRGRVRIGGRDTERKESEVRIEKRGENWLGICGFGLHRVLRSDAFAGPWIRIPGRSTILSS
jgi:hypothetical protein